MVDKETIADLVNRAKSSLEGVTPGPWSVQGSHWQGMDWANYDVVPSAPVLGGRRRVCQTRYGNDAGEADATFIAQARTLIPELIGALESLTPPKIILKEDWDSPETNAAIAADFYDESPND